MRGLASLIELAERDAWGALWRLCPTPLAHELGLRVESLGSVLVTSMAAIDHPLFNRVTALGVEETATEAALDAALGSLAAAGATRFHVYLSPEARPVELAEWLERRGLVPSDRFAKLARRTAGAPAASATELAVREVGREDADRLGLMLCEAYELPPELGPWLGATAGAPEWRVLAVLDGDAFVSAAALHLGREAGWLGMAGTLPSHRGRGGQQTLIAHRVRAAAASGRVWVCSEAPEPPLGDPISRRNLERAGFAVVCDRPSFGPPA